MVGEDGAISGAHVLRERAKTDLPEGARNHILEAIDARVRIQSGRADGGTDRIMYASNQAGTDPEVFPQRLSATFGLERNRLALYRRLSVRSGGIPSDPADKRLPHRLIRRSPSLTLRFARFGRISTLATGQ